MASHSDTFVTNTSYWQSNIFNSAVPIELCVCSYPSGEASAVYKLRKLQTYSESSDPSGSEVSDPSGSEMSDPSGEVSDPSGEYRYAELACLPPSKHGFSTWPAILIH